MIHRLFKILLYILLNLSSSYFLSFMAPLQEV